MARRRPIKLKSYGTAAFSPRSRRRRAGALAVRILLLAALAAGVFAVGWFGASRCIDAITHFWYAHFSAAPASSQSETQPPEDSSQAQPASSQQPASSSQPAAPPAPPSPANDTAGRWGEVPLGAFSSEETLRQALAELAAAGADRALVTLKDTRGYVYFDSRQTLAVQGEAVRATVDVAQYVRLCGEYGLVPAARLTAFHDPLAAYADRTAAVQYRQEGILWLDTSLELGGRPWLNPYSQTARDYVLGLAQELAQLGIQELVFDGVQFPDGYSLEMCYYGEAALQLSRTDCLRECVAMLQSGLQPLEVSCWFEWPADAALDAGQQAWQLRYGDGPAALGAWSVLLAPRTTLSAEGVPLLPACDAAALSDFAAAAGESGALRLGLALDVLAADEALLQQWRTAAGEAGFGFFAS